MSHLIRSTRKWSLAVLVLGLLVSACAPLAASGSARSSQAESAAAAASADLRVHLVGLLEALGPDSATVGGQRLIVTESTVLNSALLTNQLVEAQAVMAGDELAALAIQPAVSGRAAGQTFELLGALQRQAGDDWVIGGHIVQVDAARTQVTGALNLGDFVRVRGSSSAGDLLASEIQAVSPAATAGGAEVEFTGTVTSIGANAWVVGGRVVQVSPQTEIKAGVTLGGFVKVHALPQADGGLVAREIELSTPAAATSAAPRANEQEFTGVLSAINGDLWTVGGQVVRIHSGTELKGAVILGSLVKVHATPGGDGVLVAREIERARADDRGGDDDNDDGSNRGPGDDDNSGRGGDDDDNSGRGGGDDDDDDDNSGRGGGDDDDDDDNSGSGGGDDDDDDNSGSGGDDDDDDDNSGHGGGDDDDDDDD